MIVNGFELGNEEKLQRVVSGSLTADGSMIGGLGEDADPNAVLAAYDKLGGLITKNGDRVKTGSFYDFKAKEARKKPEVVYVFRIGNKETDVPEGTELPGEVRAARILAAAGKDDEPTTTTQRPPRKRRARSAAPAKDITNQPTE